MTAPRTPTGMSRPAFSSTSPPSPPSTSLVAGSRLACGGTPMSASSPPSRFPARSRRSNGARPCTCHRPPLGSCLPARGFSTSAGPTSIARTAPRAQRRMATSGSGVRVEAFSMARWALWKTRFGEITTTQGLKDDVKDIAAGAAAEMARDRGPDEVMPQACSEFHFQSDDECFLVSHFCLLEPPVCLYVSPPKEVNRLPPFCKLLHKTCAWIYPAPDLSPPAVHRLTFLLFIIPSCSVTL